MVSLQNWEVWYIYIYYIPSCTDIPTWHSEGIFTNWYRKETKHRGRAVEHCTIDNPDFLFTAWANMFKLMKVCTVSACKCLVLGCCVGWPWHTVFCPWLLPPRYIHSLVNTHNMVYRCTRSPMTTRNMPSKLNIPKIIKDPLEHKFVLFFSEITIT